MIDITLFVVLALCVLAGYYRGTIYASISIGVTILSFLIALLFVPLLSGAVRSSEDIYGSLVYYFEGYEYVSETSLELIHEPAVAITDEQLDVILYNADMPIPMGKSVEKNIKNQVYADQGIITLGDYFNQTIVDVVLNILSLLVLFVCIRTILGFVLRMIDHGMKGFPSFNRFDAPFSCGIGFLHGILLLYVVFLLAPVAFTVVPALEEYLNESFFGGFFYRVNPLLYLIPTT